MNWIFIYFSYIEDNLFERRVKWLELEIFVGCCRFDFLIVIVCYEIFDNKDKILILEEVDKFIYL